jgi:hypothetical protein
LDLFERWYQQHDGDVRSSVGALKSLVSDVEGDTAFARLEGAVRKTTSTVSE